MNTEIWLLTPAAKVTKKTDDMGLKMKLFVYPKPSYECLGKGSSNKKAVMLMTAFEVL